MHANTKGQRGFALLTVIFFVLALTILGLSLFSLSNYEAGFYHPAVNRTVAVQAARGAIDWARFIIESEDDLNKVTNASTRPALVQYAVARYGGEASDDSTSKLFDNVLHTSPYSPIWMKVVAGSGDQQQAVVAQFQPDPGINIYKRLITATEYVWVNRNEFPTSHSGGVGKNRIDQLWLYGQIATPLIRDENNQDPSALIKGNWRQLPLPTVPNGFPEPDADLNAGSAWWLTHSSVANVENATGSTISLTSGGRPYAIYLADADDVGSGRHWSVYGSLQTINVTGTCVWMLPQGLRTDEQVDINSTGGSATLILVARRDPVDYVPTNVPETGVGFAFLGGIRVTDPNMHVFIVSTGGVELEQVNDEVMGDASSPFLSIYAPWVHIQSPIDPGLGGTPPAATYQHGTAYNPAAEDAAGNLVDQLVEKDLLPNSHFCRRHLTLTAGTWQEAGTGTEN